MLMRCTVISLSCRAVALTSLSLSLSLGFFYYILLLSSQLLPLLVVVAIINAVQCLLCCRTSERDKEPDGQNTHRANTKSMCMKYLMYILQVHYWWLA